MAPLAQSLLTLFSVIALGLLLGKLRLGGMSLDYAAVILVGLAFGALGLQIPEIFQSLGLILFVFSVGMQSGPGFLQAFGRNAVRFLVPTVLMILLSAGLWFWLTRWLAVDPGLALGLFTGGRSSNSALAVGVQNSGSALTALGHSVAYPLAVLSILLYVRLMPVVFRVSLAEEEQCYKDDLLRAHPPLITRTYRVENPGVVGQTLSELHLGSRTGVTLSRIMHYGLISLPQPSTRLELGDLVKAVGSEESQSKAGALLGPEAGDDLFFDIPADLNHEAQWILVTQKQVVNLPLNRLNLPEKFGATVTRLQRNGVEIPPRGTTFLRYGDKIMVVSGKSVSPAIRDLIGGTQPSVDKDFVPLFVIVAVGLLLGQIELPFSLGMTGSVLILSILMSAVAKTGKVLWAVSESSIRFSRHLGLLFFLSAVGTKAGGSLFALLSDNGLTLVLVSVSVAVVPLLVMTLFGRFVLKMDLLTLMGLVSGATTCSPALGVATGLSTVNAPTVAYAAAFPFAMIFMMLCTQFLALLPL